MDGDSSLSVRPGPADSVEASAGSAPPPPGDGAARAPWRAVARELRHDFAPRRLPVTLVAGAMAGIVSVSLAVSLATLIFRGPLAEHLPAGVGLALFATVTLSVIAGLGTSVPGTVVGTQDMPAAVLAVAAAGVATRTGAGDAFPSVLAMIVVATVVTGVVMFVLGTLRLGGLTRFLPYPVIGGFLAATGLLLVEGGAGILADGAALVPLGAGAVAVWLPAFALTVWLLVGSGGGAMLLAVLGGSAVLHLGYWLAGVGPADALDRGWVLGPFPTGVGWSPGVLAALADAEWSVVAAQAGSIGTVALLAVVALLLNAHGLEAAVDRDFDLNRELRVTGVANALTGLGGGLPGYAYLSDTVLAARMAGLRRGVPLISGVVALLFFFLGPPVLSLIPRAVVGALLLFLGASLLIEWVWDSRTRLSRADYLLVVGILAAVAAFGVIPGVGLGLVIAIILFVVRYSRVDAVKHRLTGRTYHSNIDRPAVHQQALQAHGDQLLIFELQGYLFFGTAQRLLETVESRVDAEELPPLRYVVFDLTAVTGLDSSAQIAVEKIRRLAERHGFEVVFATLDDGVAAQLRQSDESGQPRIQPDLDHAVAVCEEALLAAVSDPLANAEVDVGQRLAEELGTPAAARILPRLRRLHVEPGERLMRQGDPSPGLYFIESGKVSAVLDGDVPTRLRTMQPGTLIGEVSLYQGSRCSATVIADEPTVVLHLPADDFGRMADREPDVAGPLHHLVARVLAERLTDAEKTLRALRE